MLNLNTNELSQQFQAGQLSCPHCRALFSREGLEPLSTIPCPECGKTVLVGTMVGKYYLQEPVADTSGKVFLAASQEERDVLPVVVKLLPVSSPEHPEPVRALWTEAQVGGLLNDTDFVTGCLDHGISNGYYYIVRPFIEGERLDQRIARAGKLPAPSAITLTLHLLAGLQHLFRKGFLYRNLRPENVFLNANGYGVLYDLGQCRTLADAAEPQEQPQTAQPYAPPERLMGKAETIASDLYSLGMTLFFAATGHHYFTTDETADLLAHQFRGKRPANPHLAELPTSLSILLDTLLRFNPVERPQACIDVADTLKAILTELEED